jgi:plasmid stabilization system protein ParE
MEVIILSGADSDLDEIYSLLDETSGGDAFLRALDRKLELLRKFPKLAARSKIGAVRRTRVGKSVYGLFYTIEGNRLMVVALQDLRQDPKTIARTIRRRF